MQYKSKEKFRMIRQNLYNAYNKVMNNILLVRETRLVLLVREKHVWFFSYFRVTILFLSIQNSFPNILKISRNISWIWKSVFIKSIM